MKILKDTIDFIDGVTGAITHPLGEIGRDLQRATNNDTKPKDKRDFQHEAGDKGKPPVV